MAVINSSFLFSVHFHIDLYEASFKQKTHKPLKRRRNPSSVMSHTCPYLILNLLMLHFIWSLFLVSPFLSRHNQRSLEVQKDPVHKNRCHVRFPEVFSSYPYTVNLTAVNALGKASATTSFEESNIGKANVVSRYVWLCCIHFSLLSLCYSVMVAEDGQMNLLWTKFEFGYKTNYRLFTAEPCEHTLFPDEVLLRMNWFNLGPEPTRFKGNTLPI